MMQIVIEDSDKAAILKLLVNEDINVLKQAYAYVKNLDIPTVIDEAPTVQAVPISELKNLREEMGNITDIKTYHERNLIWTCLCMLDNLIESYEEESAD